jgi:excinuclease ABC subunit B
MFADHVTDSMRRAIDETYRRRQKQIAYNEEHNIVPVGIVKGIRDLSDRVKAVAEEKVGYSVETDLPKEELARLIKDLEAQMRTASRSLEFERAAELRDQIVELRRRID